MTQLSLGCLAIAPPVGALLLLASTAWVSRHRWPTMQRRPVNRALLLLAVGLTVTCGFAHAPGEAWLGLVHFLPYFWVCAAQAELIQWPAQRRRIAMILALTVIPLVIIGLGELYLGWSSPPQLAGVLPWPPQAGGTPPGRMGSVFAYANNLALYLNVTWTLSLGMLAACTFDRSPAPPPALVSRPASSPVDATAHTTVQKAASAPRTVTRTGGNRNAPPLSQQPEFWLLVLLFNGVGLLLTQSRSAWALALFSALCLAAYRGWTWIVTAFASAGVAVVWAAFGPVGQAPLRRIVPEFIWARLTDQNFSDRPIATLRLTQWDFAWQMAQDRPLTGWGLRNFSPLYEAATQTWMGHPHNLFLMLGAEVGLFLTGGLLGWVAWIFYRGIEVLWRQYPLDRVDSLLFFSVLIAFLNVSIFHLFDVPLFDFRINALGWMIITQILGVVYLSDAGNLNLCRTEQYSAD